MDSSGIIADQVLDVRGLSCPIPLLKTKKALESIGPGQILQIICADPGSRLHIPELGKRTGNQFLGMLQAQNGCTIYFIKKVKVSEE